MRLNLEPSTELDLNLEPQILPPLQQTPQQSKFKHYNMRMSGLCLRSTNKHCDSVEYFEALSAENDAIRAMNAVSLLREAASAACNECVSSKQRSSPKYYEADQMFWQHTKTIIDMRIALHVLSDVTRCAKRKCLDAYYHPPLAAAPTCFSLEFPEPSRDWHSHTPLPCPDLWTVLAISAAVRTTTKLPKCTSLCLSLDAASDIHTVRVRFNKLAKLLHPDRWLVIWPAALVSVPAAWAAVLDLSQVSIGDTAAAEANRGRSVYWRSKHRRWTAVDVRAAAEVAFIAAREAYEALCVAKL